MDNKTPDNKQEFKWNDALVSECVSFCHEINKSGTTQVKYWGKDLVQEFIKSKEHKVEEKMAIKFIETDSQFLEANASCYEDWYYMPFWFQKIAPCIYKRYSISEIPKRLKEDLLQLRGEQPVPENKPQESKQDSKGWEIVSYINPNIITDIPNGNIEKPNGIAVIRDYPIYSVRRLSDGEVFSLGDEEDFVGKITAIRIDAKYSGGIGLAGDCRTRAIETAIKLPLTEQPKQVKKPPLGLIPKHIWEEQRIWDIAEAIERYQKAGKEIPKEWLAEDKILRKEKNTTL